MLETNSKDINKKVKELEKFKERFEQEKERKIFLNKISILITSLIIAITFFYSSYTIKSINTNYNDLPLIPQLILIFNIIAIASSIFFITFLIYLIKKMIKEKKKIH